MTDNRCKQIKIWAQLALPHTAHLEMPFFSARVMPSAMVSTQETMKKLPVIFITLAW